MEEDSQLGVEHGREMGGPALDPAGPSPLAPMNDFSWLRPNSPVGRPGSGQPVNYRWLRNRCSFSYIWG